MNRYFIYLLALLLIGITNAFVYQYKPLKIPIGKQNVCIEINSLYKQKEKYNTYFATISNLNNEKILLSTNIDTELYKYDQIITQLELKEVKNFENLSKFDRKAYFNNQNIYFESFLSSKQQYQLHKTEPNIIQKLKKAIKTKINTKLKDKNVQSFANSLILGDKSSLSYELKQNFMYTGTAHILAISGLHIGILFLVLTLLFFPFFKFKRIEFIGILMVIATVILYTYLAESPVSALRATMMLVLYLIAQLSHQKKLITNFLFSASFFIILVKPNEIFSIGFYLSVGAVLSILMFYPYLPKLKSKNKFLNFLWGIPMVTLAVQPITAILCAYFFDIFPVYFMISNCATLLLLYGFIISILFFLVLPFDFLSYGVELFGHEIFRLNDWVFRLPNSTLSLNWSILGFSCFLLSIFCFYFCLLTKKISFFNLSLSLFLVGNLVEFLK